MIRTTWDVRAGSRPVPTLCVKESKAALLNTKRAMTPDRTDSTGRHTGWDCGVADPRDTGDWRG